MPVVPQALRKSVWQRDHKNNMAATAPSMPMTIGRFTLPYAAILAIVIEATLIAALLIGLSDKKESVRSSQSAVMLSFPVIARTQPKPQPTPLPRVPVKTHPRPKPIHHHHITHHAPVHKTEPPKPLPTPAPVPKSAPVTPPIPQAAATTINADAMSQFEEQVHEAIQASLRYPYAAKIAHIEGRVKVSFEYINGQVSAIKIINASSYGMFNSAAQQAVLNANYPPLPEKLAGRQLQFEVWVRFDQINVSTN